jgi:hypothetical protein
MRLAKGHTAIRNLSVCRDVRLNKVDEDDYPVEHRNLFSEADMITVMHSLRDLPWKVAFQFSNGRTASKHGD